MSDIQFSDIWKQENWLANEQKPYRKLTEALNGAIRANDVSVVQAVLNSVKDPKTFINSPYFCQTGFHSPSYSDIKAGDASGPMFESHGPMVEKIQTYCHGIRPLGIALEAQADDVFKYLIENGARIPSGKDFPDEAFPLASKAGYDQAKTEGIVTVITSDVGAAPKEAISEEYIHALEQFVLRGSDKEEQAARRELVANTLGVALDKQPKNSRIGPKNPDVPGVNRDGGGRGA